MSIIRPPVSGDSPQDSWANQVTEAINKGLLAPSINAAAPAANVSLNGLSAATIYLYTRTNTANAPAAVDVDITYDYKNITYSPSAPFGTANWELSPPGTANGNYLWITLVNISANTEKEIIPFASWSTPTIFTVNGDSSFVCEAFIRSATTPGQPSGGSYNFNTTTLTPPTGSPASEVWSSAIPGGTDPVYICTAIAVITGSTGSDNNLAWSQPIKMVENGAVGANGLTGASTDIIFQRSATQPTTPSASAGTPSGWYSSASSAVGTDLLWAASGTKAVGSSTFTWSAPFQIEGKAVAEVAIYRLNSNAGLANSTYDFTTNTLTPPAGWSTSVPALSGTGDVIYRASGIVSGSALETSATVTYGSAVIFAQRTDGLTGASTNIIFQRSASAPTTPSASAGVPTGWYDSASGAIGTDVLWASSGTKAIGATNFTWTTPFQIEGEAVTEVAIYRLNSNAGLTSSTYDFTTNTLTPPTGWSTNAPALVSNGDIVYRASGIASGSSLKTSATVSFGTPVIFAQRIDGATGASSNIIFQRSASIPVTPSPSAGVPTGWYDSAASAIGTDLLWASSGIKTVGSTNFTWTTPFRIEGEAVVEVAVYRLNNNTGLATGTYNFATNTLTPPTNWSTTLPSIVSNGDIVYRASGIASGSAIETSASVTFGTPVIFSQRTDGTDGAPAVNTAVVYAYKWGSAVATDAPITTRTYTFSTSAWDNTDGGNNWTLGEIPTKGNNTVLSVCVAIASSTSATDNVVAADWSSAQIITQDGDNGVSTAVVNAYKRSASALASTDKPSTTRTWTFSSGTWNNNDLGNGWSGINPSGTDNLYFCIAVASANTATDNVVAADWTAPQLLVSNGTNGTNGTDGTDGSELESGLVYYTTAQASSPGTPSASDYNFSTGAFVGLSTGWQTQPVVVNITSTTALFWSARYRVTKAAGASTATVTFNAPVASVNFGTNIQSDNYVTGSSGWQIQRASGNAEFGNITARGALESANFDGTFNSLSQTLSTYSSATGVFAANTWGLRDGFSNNASNIAATSWNDYLDPVSNTVHVVLKIRASTAAQTKIISQLGRGQQLTITRNASNYAVFEVWTAGYLPEDGNTAYVQLRTLVGTATGTPASSAITIAASDVVDPGTEGYSFDNDKSVINSGTLDVANIRINGSIQAKNLDIGVTLQSKSGNRSGVSTSWLEFLRIETTDSPDFNTDVTYSSSVTVVSEAGVGDIVLVKVLDNSQLGTEGTATYSSSQIGLSVGSVTTFANTIDSASIQANSPNASSAFTTSMSDSNVNVSRGTIYLFCYRERPGGDTAIGCSANASITEVRRPA